MRAGIRVTGPGPRRTVAWAAAALGALIAPPAAALQWYWHPTATMSTQYNDNPHLSVHPHPSVEGLIARSDVALGARSEVAGISLEPRVNAYRYWGETGLDHVDRGADFKAYYNDERDIWNMSATYLRNSTLVSELLDSGVVQVNKPRRYVDVQPSWTRNWSERGTVQAALDYSTVSYTGGVPIGLYDYRTLMGSIEVDYQWSQRDRIGLTTSVTRFEVPDLFSNISDSVILEATWRRSWSPRLQSDLNGGWQINRTGYDIFGFKVHDTQSGFIVNGDVSYKWELSSLSLSAGRRVDPSSIGVLAQRDNAAVSAAHSFSHYLEGSAGASWLNNRSIRNSLVTRDLYIHEFYGRLNWYVTQNITLGCEYSWLKRKYNGAGTATANTVTVDVTYRDVKRM